MSGIDPTLFERAAKYMRTEDLISIDLDDLKWNTQRHLAREIQGTLAGTETHRNMELAINNIVRRLELIDVLICARKQR